MSAGPQFQLSSIRYVGPAQHYSRLNHISPHHIHAPSAAQRLHHELARGWLRISSQDVAWLKRDVLLFAHIIGRTVDELHFIYVCALCK